MNSTDRRRPTAASPSSLPRHGLRLAVLLCALCAAVPSAARAQYMGAAPEHEPTPARGLVSGSDVVTALLATPRPLVTLKPGDEIQIEIFEIEKFAYKTRVNTDGVVSMPLIASISVNGLTADQAGTAIAHRLETDGMVNDPHVHVTVLENPSELITVAGNVVKPGVFPAFGSRTLISVLSEAEGLRELASRTITLTRPSPTGGVAQSYTLNLGADPATSRVGAIPVFAGDTVTVGAVGLVYVVGAVKTSGVYKLKTETPTTAVQAIAMAGGAGFEGYKNRVEIIRTVNGVRSEITFNYLDALRHGSTDPVLMADDIVFVPTAAMKAALKGGGLGIAVALVDAIFYR